MIYKLLRRLAPARLLRAERGVWDENLQDLGFAAEVSGLFWKRNQKFLTKNGFACVGSTDWSLDRVVIARYIDTQLFFRFLFWLLESKWQACRFLWTWGILDTPEGQRISFRLHLRVAFWRVLRSRYKTYGLCILPSSLRRAVSYYQTLSRKTGT